MILTTQQGRYYRGENQGSEKFSETEVLAEVTLLLRVEGDLNPGQAGSPHAAWCNRAADVISGGRS